MSNIEAERARLQLTKEQMAKALGITSKTYLSYTRGSAIPSPVLLRMSRMFHCTTDYLLGANNLQINTNDPPGNRVG